MDLIKIGVYIAEKRKSLGLTQRQLAEKLGMSDKSVSKWERGICLPDVSVYSDLCRILGISIHEFLAGEDIPKENVLQKSEENILGMASDSKLKQNRLKTIICILLVLSILVLSVLGVWAYREWRPQNFMEPLGSDSTEMQTAKLFAGPEGAHIFKFTTTDAYKTFRIYLSEYQAGEQVSRDTLMELGFQDIGSPESGVILIFPDFANFEVRVVFSAEGARYATNIPILEDVEDRNYYGRSASSLQENTAVLYGQEQPLLALYYDNDILSAYNVLDIPGGTPEFLRENDYMYYFSYEFSKE